MALGISLTGILLIIVIVLALVVVLMGMATRVKRLKTELKEKEEDIITPYLRAVTHYKQSNFDSDTKINALNKISKQFFRDIYKFNSEKTFEEISELASESEIKKFCNSMGIIRYSKNLGRKDLDELYDSFEKILSKRKPDWAPEVKSEAQKNPLTMEELMSKKMNKDITEIKTELEKMTAANPPKQNPALKIKDQVDLQANPSAVEEKLNKLTEEIDKTGKTGQFVEERQTQIQQQPPRVQQVQSPEAIAAVMRARENIQRNLNPPVRRVQEIDLREIRDNIRGSRAQRIVPNESDERPPIKTVKWNYDEEDINRQIINLNHRIQRLVEEESDRRLDSSL